MWIYSALQGILILRGLRLIAPCLPPEPGRRAIIDIMRLGSRGPYRRSFHFSHTLVLKIGSIVGLLVGCSGGQFSQHWSGS